MSVSAVSFGRTPKMEKNKQAPNIRTTKQGNPYYHTNIGKKLGGGIGLAGALISAATMYAMTRNLKASLAIAGMYSAPSIVGGLVGGAIFDGMLNHNEKKKADQMAAYYA